MSAQGTHDNGAVELTTYSLLQLLKISERDGYRSRLSSSGVKQT